MNHATVAIESATAIDLTWLRSMAAFAALTVDRFWYFPTPERTFVTDADFVVSVDESGEWLNVWHFGETTIHVSQLDRPITRRNDPDRRFQDWSWNDHVTGNGNVKPSEVL